MHTRCTRTTAICSPWSPPAYGSRASLYKVDRHDTSVNLGINLASLVMGLISTAVHVSSNHTVNFTVSFFPHYHKLTRQPPRRPLKQPLTCRHVSHPTYSYDAEPPIFRFKGPPRTVRLHQQASKTFRFMVHLRSYSQVKNPAFLLTDSLTYEFRGTVVIPSTQ